MSAPVLSVRQLKKHFSVSQRKTVFGSKKTLYAVDGVTFDINSGETLSLVGESGCGKSTVGRTILCLFSPTSGEVHLNGKRIDDLPVRKMRPLRKHLQVIFQDPFSSLNPRMSVRDIIAEPLKNFGITVGERATTERVVQILENVGLPSDVLRRRPHEFSGGQRQRIGIARAIAAQPDVIICDEAVSALDVSLKAQIVNLLCDLQREKGLALLFISHDLAIVEHMTHRVAVMYLGVIVEIGTKADIFLRPKHPYTAALLSSVLVPDPKMRKSRIALKGEIPSPIDLPKGCRFSSRCPLAFDRCYSEEPALRAISQGHLSACHLSQ
ncbi:MAG: ABC transporter ATP-binding protein [Alphaproteobacteria bacterium]